MVYIFNLRNQRNMKVIDSIAYIMHVAERERGDQKKTQEIN